MPRRREDRGEDLVVVGFAKVHLTEATRSAGRAERARDDGDASQEAGAAAAAILLACAAVEAYLSEIATLKDLPDHVLREVRDGRDPFHTRFLRFLESVTFSRADAENSDQFKNLRCLAELRNGIAHRWAAFLEQGTWPGNLGACKNFLPAREPGIHDWTSSLLVAEVAGWSARTAELWLEWVECRLHEVETG